MTNQIYLLNLHDGVLFMHKISFEKLNLGLKIENKAN